MLKKIVKKLMRFPENCIFVKIVTFGARQLLEQPKHSHIGSAYDVDYQNPKLCSIQLDVSYGPILVSIMPTDMVHAQLCSEWLWSPVQIFHQQINSLRQNLYSYLLTGVTG